MPEMPEVQGLADFLRTKLLPGDAPPARVSDVEVLSFAVLKTASVPLDALQSGPVTAVERKGKYLIISAGGVHLVMHLGKAGWLRWSDGLKPGRLPSGQGPDGTPGPVRSRPLICPRCPAASAANVPKPTSNASGPGRAMPAPLEGPAPEDSKRRALRVHARTGELCPVCGDTVREVSFADSSLQYCPTCQTGGKLLADRRMSRLLK